MISQASAYSALYKYTKALSAALGYRDTMTRLHSERVRTLAQKMGVECGLSGEEMDILQISASFHDIGKIGVADAILLKTCRLEGDEWEKMKLHAEMGEQIMAATELPGSLEAAKIIRHHHEHYCGNGYPDGLAGEAIPICSRIIGIADNYDAMAETRSYHRARSHAEIMAVMERETEEKHDPALMEIFCRFIGSSEFRTSKA